MIIARDRYRGDVQSMSAGTGVTHSERNASKTEPAHFRRIWIVPEARRIAPGSEQKRFPREETDGRLRLIADRWSSHGAITVHQYVTVSVGQLSEGERSNHGFAQGRRGWRHVVRGLLRLSGDELREGDDARIEGECRIELGTDHHAEILPFDLK